MSESSLDRIGLYLPEQDVVEMTLVQQILGQFSDGSAGLAKSQKSFFCQAWKLINTVVYVKRILLKEVCFSDITHEVGLH